MSNVIEAGIEPNVDYRVRQLPSSSISAADFIGPAPASDRSSALCWTALIVAALTAVVANLLFRTADGIGMNLLILMVIFFSGWFGISRYRSVPLWRKLCAGAAIVYAGALGFRASEIIALVNGLLFFGVLALACSPAAGAAVRSVCVMIVSVWQVIANALAGALLFGTEMPWSAMKPKRETGRIAWRVIVGLIIAAPFLLVFGGLFSQADSKFQHIFVTAFSQIFDALFSYFWLTFWAFIFALGLLRSAFFARTITEGHLPMRGQRIGFVESATVLVLLNGMFLIFVATQMPYLFGGQKEISGSPGLVWSTYARRGFFELAMVVALVVPTLMLFTNLTCARIVRQRMMVRGLCIGLSLLTGVIIVSAFQRMMLYTTNYGLSELRVYVSTFIVLLALILVLLNAFSLMGRSEWFLPASLCLGVVFSLGIQTVNVQGIVAADIIERHLAGKDGDMEYLAQLSTDAVPVIWGSDLSQDARRRICGRIILRRSGKIVTGDKAEYLDYPVSTVQAVALVDGI